MAILWPENVCLRGSVKIREISINEKLARGSLSGGRSEKGSLTDISGLKDEKAIRF